MEELPETYVVGPNVNTFPEQKGSGYCGWVQLDTALQRHDLANDGNTAYSRAPFLNKLANGIMTPGQLMSQFSRFGLEYHCEDIGSFADGEKIDRLRQHLANNAVVYLTTGASFGSDGEFKEKGLSVPHFIGLHGYDFSSAAQVDSSRGVFYVHDTVVKMPAQTDLPGNHIRSELDLLKGWTGCSLFQKVKSSSFLQWFSGVQSADALYIAVSAPKSE